MKNCHALQYEASGEILPFGQNDMDIVMHFSTKHLGEILPFGQNDNCSVMLRHEASFEIRTEVRMT
jgi:hypothetical protein